MSDGRAERHEEEEERKRRGGMVGGSTAVVDEVDMAFGVMATIAIVIGLMVALLPLGGTASEVATDDTADVVEEVAVTEAPVEEEVAEEPTTTTTEAPAPDPADAVVTVSADGIVLTGTVPDEATAQALLDEALASFPEASVTNELEIVDGADPFSLTVTGEAANAATFGQLTSGFATLGSAATAYTDELTQAESTGADAVVTATQGGITLIGTVPDEATAQALSDAAFAVYSEVRVVDELVILDGADPYTLTVTGETTDPILFSQVNGAFDPLGDAAGEYTNTLEQAESSDVEAELNALDQILFQSGTDVILPESRAVVEAAAAIMLANPDVAFEVGGHTDTRGSDVSNLVLSEARAAAVTAALVDLDVTNELTPVGYGEARPLDANDTTAQLQQANRRIEFRVL